MPFLLSGFLAQFHFYIDNLDFNDDQFLNSFILYIHMIVFLIVSEKHIYIFS